MLAGAVTLSLQGPIAQEYSSSRLFIEQYSALGINVTQKEMRDHVTRLGHDRML